MFYLKHDKHEANIYAFTSSKKIRNKFRAERNMKKFIQVKKEIRKDSDEYNELALSGMYIMSKKFLVFYNGEFISMNKVLTKNESMDFDYMCMQVVSKLTVFLEMEAGVFKKDIRKSLAKIIGLNSIEEISGSDWANSSNFIFKNTYVDQLAILCDVIGGTL
jgi:hypothetical protein